MFLGYEKGKDKFKRPDGKWVVDDLKINWRWRDTFRTFDLNSIGRFTNLLPKSTKLVVDLGGY
jgi:hypothetical protein